jgi:hypothetical protein
VSTTPAQPGSISGTTSVCQGSSHTYSIAAVSGATSYAWFLPSGWSGSSTSTSIDATAGASGGTISVTASNSCGTSNPATLSISVTALPAQPGSISGATSVCQGSSNTYSIAAVSGASSYTWSLPSGWSGSSTSTSIDATAGATGGTISVTANNSCGTSNPGTLSVSVSAIPPAPTVDEITQPTCDQATGSVVLSGLPASGTWTLTRTPGEVISTQTGTNITISGLSAGFYTYTVTNESGCTSGVSDNVEIISNPETPTAPSVGVITQPINSLQTGSVTLNSLPATGTWTLTRTPGGISFTGTGTDTMISGLEAGTFFYTVTNESGCTSGTSVDIVINHIPMITGQKTLTIHEDSLSTITVTDLVINDSDNTPEQMTVNISTGNNYTISGGNTITPVTNFNGTLIIPVTVNDGIATSNIFNVFLSVTEVNDFPVIDPIPHQIITQDSVFATINLDEFVEDIETSDEMLAWTFEGNNELLVNIVDRIVNITVPEAGWKGSDTIVFTAKDDDATNPLNAIDTVIFTVNEETGFSDSESPRIYVYPNPAKDWINIEFPELYSKRNYLDIQILTIQGKVLSNSRKNILTGNPIEIDIHELNSGSYFIRLITSDKVRTFKIIKQ